MSATLIPWLPVCRDALDLEYGADRPRVATLASVDEANRPRARSVVLRRVDDDGAAHFVSDGRSAKVAHLRRTPFAEVVLWLTGRREQFRLFGGATVTAPGDDGPLRKALWTGLTDAARALFFWPAPGTPSQTEGGDDFPPAVSVRTPAPESFGVITVRAEEVEHLQLHFTPHRRTRYRRDEGWEARAVNP
jgi:PPOX class probable FMN-dependent enzyme